MRLRSGRTSIRNRNANDGTVKSSRTRRAKSQGRSRASVRRRKRSASARKKSVSKKVQEIEDEEDEEPEPEPKHKPGSGASLRQAVARTLEASKTADDATDGNASDSDCLVSDLSDIDSPSGSDDPGMNGSVDGILTTPPSIRYRLKQIMKRKQWKYLISSKYLRRGYRAGQGAWDAFLSLFWWHNETMNIWTHLLPALFFVYLIVAAPFAAQMSSTPFTGLTSALTANGTIDAVGNDTIHSIQEVVASIYDKMGELDLGSKSVLDGLRVVQERAESFDISCPECWTAAAETFESINATLTRRMEELAQSTDTMMASAAEVAAPITSEMAKAAEHAKRSYNKMVTDATQARNDLDKMVRDASESMQAELEKGLVELGKAYGLNETELEQVGVAMRSFEGMANDMANDMARAAEEGMTVSMISTDSPSDVVSRWPIMVFLVTALFCLGSSTIYHWFCCIGRDTSNLLVALDHAAISALIAGSYFPIMYYSFWCWPVARMTYLGIATFLGFATLSLALYNIRDLKKIFDRQGMELSLAAWKKFKVLSYVAFGFFGVVPFTHLGLIYGNGEPVHV